MTFHLDNQKSATIGSAAPSVVASVQQQLEADHRISNSLQLLSALLSAEARCVVDPAAKVAIDVSVQRITAIAGIHRQLYRTGNSGDVEIGPYLVTLIESLRTGCCSSAGHRRLHLEVGEMSVPAGFATAIGVIITELVVNACKYAYPPDERGDIDIVVVAAGNGSFSLRVRDQGSGRAVAATHTGLGSQILELMARRLGANGGYVPGDRGTTFEISGPLPRS